MVNHKQKIIMQLSYPNGKNIPEEMPNRSNPEKNYPEADPEPIINNPKLPANKAN